MLNLILTVLVIIAGIALFFYFWKGRGFTGKGLRYAIAVIIFTAIALIGLINHEFIFAFLENHLGTWGTTGVLLVFCAIFGLAMYILF